MVDIEEALSRALLSYISKVPGSVLSDIRGDRLLFQLIAARVHICHLQSNPVSAHKVAFEAENINISHRTALRMCDMMIEDGYIDVERRGRSRILWMTEKLQKFLTVRSLTAVESAKLSGLLTE